MYYDVLRKQKAVYITCLLMLMCLFSLVAKAEGELGKVLFVHGDVRILGVDGVARIPEKGSLVFQGEKIITQEASSLQLQMTDDGYFAVRPSSEIRIDAYQFKQQENDRVEASIIRGGLRSITGAIGKKDKKAFKLRTPVATIGIRGTDFEAFFLDQQMASAELGNQGSYVLVNNGGSYLQNAAGIQDLAAGQAAYVASPNSMPVMISSLPGIFELPDLETLIPGVNSDEEPPSEEPAKPPVEEEREPEPKQEEEPLAEEESKEESSDESQFSFGVHGYLGAASIESPYYNIDLFDRTHSLGLVPLLLRADSPQEGQSAMVYGVGGSLNYRPGDQFGLYAKAEIRGRNTDDDNYSLQGGRIEVGGKLNISDVLSAWLKGGRLAYSSDDYYPGQQTNSEFSQPEPGYEIGFYEAGFTLDAGRLFGVFGSLSTTEVIWDERYSWFDGDSYLIDGVYYFGDGYWQRGDNRVSHSVELAEAGVRLNPVLIPLDIYASGIIGNVEGSDGDTGIYGVRGRAELNRDGVFSLFGQLTAVEADTDSSGLLELKAGGELQFSEKLILKAAVQRAEVSSGDEGSDGGEIKDTQSEVRLEFNL